MDRDTLAETAEFFRSREQSTVERGSQLPYFPNWAPNNAVGNHGIHYITYGFQARYGTEAYALFSKVESLLDQRGVRPEPAKWVHASAFSISRELHFGAKDRNTLVDIDPALASTIERKATDYCKAAEPFSLELTGRLVVMPNTLTYEVADSGPYCDFLAGLWKAVPEFADLKIHPKNPHLSPVTERDGAAALFQAAYGTNIYDFATVQAVAEETRAFAGAELRLERVHRLWHTISSDRSDVSIPTDDLAAVGTPEAPTHWSSIPTSIIEMQGASRGLGQAL